MTVPVAKGSWVEIHRILLPAGARAPQIPEDTQRVPLEMRVKGFLLKAAELGEEAEIITTTGRRDHGTLTAFNPAYDHGFGSPIPELSTLGQEARAILNSRGKDQ